MPARKFWRMREADGDAGDAEHADELPGREAGQRDHHGHEHPEKPRGRVPQPPEHEAEVWRRCVRSADAISRRMTRHPAK